MRVCVCVCVVTRSRVSLELKCWQCLFVQPCDMIYVPGAECKCPACDQQTKQQTKPEDQQKLIIQCFPTLLHSPSTSSTLPPCSFVHLALSVLSLLSLSPSFTPFFPLSAHASILFTLTPGSFGKRAQRPALLRHSHGLPLHFFFF